MGVVVLQRDVGEEGDLLFLVERDVDVVLTGSLLLCGHFVRDGDVRLLDRILVFLHIYQTSPKVHNLSNFFLL